MQLVICAHMPDADSKQPTETFTGTVHMDPIFKADDCMANNVMFTPGARTFWHTHEKGQISSQSRKSSPADGFKDELGRTLTTSQSITPINPKNGLGALLTFAFLWCRMGQGLICSKGEKPRRLGVGDVVHIPGGRNALAWREQGDLYAAYGCIVWGVSLLPPLSSIFLICISGVAGDWNWEGDDR